MPKKKNLDEQNILKNKDIIINKVLYKILFRYVEKKKGKTSNMILHSKYIYLDYSFWFHQSDPFEK